MASIDKIEGKWRHILDKSWSFFSVARDFF